MGWVIGDATAGWRSSGSNRGGPAVARQKLYSIGRFFPRNFASDVVATSAGFDAKPEAVWRKILLYEDVPRQPPFLLRQFLPFPLRTHGQKDRAGAIVLCRYRAGELVKRITAVEPPFLLRFEVVEQGLGIESCVTALEGSYEIRPRGKQTEIVLATKYRGHLRPRRLWRPLERLLLNQLHRHILEGMRLAASNVGAGGLRS
jgi:hypothetical protein